MFTILTLMTEAEGALGLPSDLDLKPPDTNPVLTRLTTIFGSQVEPLK